MDRDDTPSTDNAHEPDSNVNSAASAGSESPEEGDAAMKAAEDAVIVDNDDDTNS